MQNIIYLDNSATTRVDPVVVSAMTPYFSYIYGNPSSIHNLGREAKSHLDNHRETIASYFNCSPREILFMASGSESDNFAIIQGVKAAKGKHIITTSVEHKTVLETVAFMEQNGYEATYLPVDKVGRISASDVEKAIRKDTALISIMAANNEVGTIMPIREIAAIAKKHNIFFHVDAVQAAGKFPLDVKELGVDFLTVCGHKMYAPKGISILYVREDIIPELTPLIHGGSHEYGLRAGTENLPYIAGMAQAFELIKGEKLTAEVARIKEMRDHFEKRMMDEIPYVVINGDLDNRVCSISNLTFKYIEAEAVIGYVPSVCCSLGSACTSDEDAGSHVLTAMGMDPVDIRGSIRFSFGRFNTMQEVDKAVDLLREGIEKLRQMSPLYKG